MDARHGADLLRPAGLRARRNRTPSPGLPGLHAAARWRLRAELLGRWAALLDRQPARRGRVSHHPGLEVVEGRRSRRDGHLSLRRACIGIPGEEGADYAPGTMG